MYVKTHFQGEQIIYPNDCLHVLYKKIILILGMKPLQVTDIFGGRDQFPLKSLQLWICYCSKHDTVNSTDN
jgi:hypothetical protein